MTSTYFDALGVPTTATAADIKRAFRNLARDLHPDNGGDVEKFKLVSRAYHELSTENAVDSYARRVRLGLLSRGEMNWSKEWEQLTGLVKPEPASSNRFRADDLEDLLRRHGYFNNAERDRAEWRRASQAQNEREERMRREREAAEANRRFREAQRKADEQARRNREQQHASYETAGKPGACNHPTKSGPCCRPLGHTPNGHMSQKVADQKRENQKRRQQGL